MQAVLGGFAFGLRETGVAYDQLQYGSGSKWATQKRVGERDAKQWLGPGKDNITLPGVIMPELVGAEATLALARLRQMKNSGQPQLLIITDAAANAGDILGKWTIEDIKETQSELLGNLPRKIEFTLKLERYAA